MKDLWIIVGVIILVSGITTACYAFFSKVWEHINLPQAKITITPRSNSIAIIHNSDERVIIVENQEKEDLK